jgi:hypothetical protein
MARSNASAKNNFLRKDTSNDLRKLWAGKKGFRSVGTPFPQAMKN